MLEARSRRPFIGRRTSYSSQGHLHAGRSEQLQRILAKIDTALASMIQLSLEQRDTGDTGEFVDDVVRERKEEVSPGYFHFGKIC